MRTAEFDREQVLRSAMAIFLEKGYGKTSMQDLKRATGLHPGSIYCAFDNKKGLLIAALKQYQQDKQSEIEVIFDKPTGLEGINAYLEQVLTECETEQIKDCLLVKALNEVTRQDQEIETLIGQMLNSWQGHLVERVQFMKDNHEICTEKSAAQLGQFLVMGIYGIRTMSHTTSDYQELRRLKADLIEYLTG